MFWDDLEIAQRSAAGWRGRAPSHALQKFLRGFKAAYLGDADRRFLWVPVCLAAGAGLYFSLTFEPHWLVCAGLLVAAGCTALALRGTMLVVPVTVLCLALTGVALAKLRTHTLMTPTVAHKAGFVEVQGWIEKAEPTAKNRIRALVRVAAISPWPDALPPVTLRITFARTGAALAPGQAVTFRARLFAPRRPVAPGAFDFARRNWFRGISGSGFAFGPVEPAVPEAEKPFDIAAFGALGRLRAAIANEVTRHLSGDTGAFVVAILTGQRGALPEEVTENLRASGLGHLLAISGLHMALVAGTLFWLVRAFLALSARATLNLPIKKWAAAIALAGGAFYLVLSGASVSTQRAFIMVAIMFGAVMLDRPAITMRNVALAALIMVTFRPESVVDVSFQMSFLAVVGLVAVFEFREDMRRGGKQAGSVPAPFGRIGGRIVLYVAGVALSSVVAGLATGPLAAYHFHRMAVFGVVANLVAVPLMALLIMPFALLGVIAMPFGLSGLFLGVVERGVQWVLDVAQWAAGLPGAVHHVAAVPESAILLVVLGILWLCLWRALWRLAGFVFIACGLALSGSAPRPALLVDEEAKVIAVRGADGALAIGSSRSARFTVERWLAADGSNLPVKDAAAGGGITCDRDACVASLPNGLKVAHVIAPRALWDVCRSADIVITRFSFSTACRAARKVIDRRTLWRHGAHAIYVTEKGISVRTVSQGLGDRPWTVTKVRRMSGKNRRIGTNEPGQRRK